MQTLVLRIPDDLAAEIEAEARRLNSTKSEVVRARLASARGSAPTPGAGLDLIADLIGVETGGPADLSARRSITSRRPVTDVKSLVADDGFLVALHRRDDQHDHCAPEVVRYRRSRKVVPCLLP